jgi:hypothetical protein
MADEEVHLDIDEMLFFAAVIEEQVEVLDAIENPIMGDMFSIAGLGEGVAEICREQIRTAQEALDALIEADKTWRPA